MITDKQRRITHEQRRKTKAVRRSIYEKYFSSMFEDGGRHNRSRVGVVEEHGARIVHEFNVFGNPLVMRCIEGLVPTKPTIISDITGSVRFSRSCNRTICCMEDELCPWEWPEPSELQRVWNSITRHHSLDVLKERRGSNPTRAERSSCELCGQDKPRISLYEISGWGVFCIPCSASVRKTISFSERQAKEDG